APARPTPMLMTCAGLVAPIGVSTEMLRSTLLPSTTVVSAWEASAARAAAKTIRRIHDLLKGGANARYRPGELEVRPGAGLSNRGHRPCSAGAALQLRRLDQHHPRAPRL